jgi:hypothetical protein
MKTRYVLLLAAIAATTSLAAGAASSSTDEARAEAAQRIAAAEHASSLRPFVQIDAEVVRVSDTDSAHQAAAQARITWKSARPTGLERTTPARRLGACACQRSM